MIGGGLLKLMARGFAALLICLAVTASISAMCLYVGLKISDSVSLAVPPGVESVAPLAVNPFPIVVALITGIPFGCAIGGFWAWEFLRWAKRSPSRERLT